VSNITFLYPAFLWGLTLVIIPILIHLFNFRRYKKIYFSNVAFLESVKEQTKFASRVKHLLILLTRILFVVFLVLTFSQPYIAQKKHTLNKHKSVTIYIDNSFSMRAQPQKGTQLDVALVAAKKTADAFPDDIMFSLITNNNISRNLSKSELNDAIQQIDFSPSFRTLPKVIRNSFSAHNNNDIFIISDFQKNFARLQNLPKDSTHQIYFIPLKNQNTSNLSIDSCWIEDPVNTPGEAVTLYFTISNFSKKNNITVPVKLFINDSLKAITKVSFDKKSVAQGIFHYLNPNTKTVLGKIQITDYPISFDNELLFAYPLKKRFHILAYTPDKDNYIDKFFENNSRFVYDLRDLSNPDYGNIDKYDFLIINKFKTLPKGIIQIIKQFLSKGKNVLFLPDYDGDINNYNLLLSDLHAQKFLQKNQTPARIEKIEFAADIFKKVFKKIDTKTKMPVIKQFFTTKHHSFNTNRIYLKTENKMPILSDTKYDKGHFFILNVPDTEENEAFFTGPLFVPIIYNISTESTNAEPLYYLAGQNNQITVSLADNKLINTDEMLHITSLGNKTDFIPYQQNQGNQIQLIISKSDIEAQGFYYIRNKKNSLKTVAFNYNRKESDLSFLSSKEISNYLTNNHLKTYKVLDNNIPTLTHTITSQNKDIEFWRWLLLVALFFLIVEILLLRFWK